LLVSSSPLDCQVVLVQMVGDNAPDVSRPAVIAVVSGCCSGTSIA